MTVKSPEPVAIVGMACLFPRSPDLATYWRNVVHAVDCITDVPEGHSWRVDEHWDPDPKAKDKTYSRRGGYLDPVPFDPLQHGITPNALDATDTSQLLALIVAREALRDAGVDPDDDGWDRQKVGVVLGVTGTQELAVTLGARLHGPTWKKAMLRCGVDEKLADAIVTDIGAHFPEWQEQSFPGLLGNVVAGRIANRLDLGGPNCVVDAACASSLAAIQLAIADLQYGRADLVLSGGVDTLNDIFMYMCFSKTPALSPTDRARPFDAEADGISISEGLSVLALKRLADAERDGDRVYAVIKAIGASSDGKGTAIYAPNPEGQVKAVERAHEAAGVDCDTIELVEAHGTGTRAGDLAEVTGLKRVFAKSKRDGRFVALGSVKSQIGHTKSTAGAAGLVKAALALHQRILPPTAKVETPNPKMAFHDSALYLNTRARPWIRAKDFPRRAGVSAFGFGGSNFHAVLEEHGDADAVTPRFTAEAELVLIGADDAAGLKARLAVDPAAPTLQHAVRPLLAQWKPAAHVVGFLARDLDDLRSKLGVAAALVDAGPGERDGVVYGVPAPGQDRVAVLFPGQGSQYVEMGRTLALRHAPVRAAFDRADEAFRAAGRPSLSSRVFPPPAFDAEGKRAHEAALTATEWAQPALGALSKGLLDLLRRFGVDGEAFAGHSYGELVALHAAGVLDEDAFWTASRVRGLAMADNGADRGTMAAVSGPLDKLDAALGALGGEVVLANRNHPRQGVISGPTAAVRKAIEALAAADLSAREIKVSAAFHSPLVADARAPFEAALADLPFHAPSRDVYSDVSAAPYPADPDEARRLLGAQITSPVDWVGIVEALWARGVRTFVECGPGRVLTGLVAKTLHGRPGWSATALDGERDHVDGDVQFKEALVRLAARGVPVDVAPLLAEPLPPEPRKPGSKATVWLGGANYKAERTKTPPPPKVPERKAPPAPAAPAPVAAKAPVPAAKAPPASNGADPVAHDRNPAPVDANALSALLQTTRDTLRAFQEAQERTARVHGQFLEAQAQANEGFQRLFDTHARLVEYAATGQMPAGDRPAPRAPAPRPAASDVSPSVQRVMESFLAQPAEPTGLEARPAAGVPREPVASHRVDPIVVTRPSVAAANDLPPLMKATLGGGALEPVAGAPKAPARTAAKATPTAGAGRDALVAATFAAVADKTGYPADLLDLAMDLEGDLGIDSIKRVEILAAVKDAVPGLPDLDNDALSRLRTLKDVVDHLGAMSPATAPAPAAKPAAGRDALVAATFAAVADKTGYPADLLDLAMDLEGDLGIDSIKRVEILAAVKDAVPGLPDLDNDALSRLRTLKDVVDHLGAMAPAAASAPAAKPAAGRDALVAATFAAVADKTGYPADLLDLAMDLEGDLGIDSIKRVEILAAVKDAVPGLPDLDNDALSRLRTLKDVVDHLGAMTPAASAPLPATFAAAPAPLRVDAAPAPARRVLRVVDAPEGAPFAPGRTAVVGDGGGVGPALVAALQARGVDAFGVAGGWRPDDGARPDSVVHVTAIGAQGEALYHALIDAFQVARAMGACRRFATVSALGGSFGQGGLAGHPLAGALAGLTKTLAQEWEATRALALDVDADHALRGHGDIEALAAEICTDRGVIEVGLPPHHAAVTLDVEDAPLEDDEPARAPVSPGDLVVVSGGARGVTAAVVQEMARRWKPAFLLLGRSEVGDDPAWAVGVADDGLKAARIAKARREGEALVPKAIDAEVAAVLAAREVRQTLAAVEAIGSPVRYAAVDARDREAVDGVVRRAEAELGPVRGIVHGAGVIADKRVEEKTDEQFDRVFGTKVGGWEALAAACDPSNLKMVAFFGSVAGRFGNLGQCDYAMANEALAHLGLALQGMGIATKVFAWGPWEAGMVTPSLKRQLEARGMSLIPLAGGARAFCDEFERGGDAVEVVFGGPEEGGALLAAPPPAPAPAAGSEVHALRGEAPFLRDHRIGGKPVLPVVMVLEWMVAAARRAFPGLHLDAVRDFAVLKGVVVDGATDVRLSWTEVPAKRQGGRTVACELLGAAGKFGPTVHYRGVVDLAPVATEAPSFPGSNGLGKHGYPYSVAEAYDRFLFHGPGLHGIASIDGMSDHGMVATLRTSTPGDLGVDGSSWQTDPVALDSVLQCMVLWVREKYGNAALPSALGTYRQFAPLAGPVQCHLEMAPTDALRGTFRADLVDAAGRVVATLEGGEYAAAPSLNAKFDRATA